MPWDFSWAKLDERRQRVVQVEQKLPEEYSMPEFLLTGPDDSTDSVRSSVVDWRRLCPSPPWESELQGSDDERFGPGLLRVSCAHSLQSSAYSGAMEDSLHKPAATPPWWGDTASSTTVQPTRWSNGGAGSPLLSSANSPHSDGFDGELAAESVAGDPRAAAPPRVSAAHSSLWIPGGKHEAVVATELAHVRPDGSRVVLARLVSPPVPAKAAHRFRLQPDITVRTLLDPATDVPPQSDSASHADHSDHADTAHHAAAAASNSSAHTKDAVVVATAASSSVPDLAHGVQSEHADLAEPAVHADQPYDADFAAAASPDPGLSHSDVARWLLTCTRLSTNHIGDFLGRPNALPVLNALVDLLDFRSLDLDEALRFYLSLFRLPGEAQQIERIIESFAR